MSIDTETGRLGSPEHGWEKGREGLSVDRAAGREGLSGGWRSTGREERGGTGAEAGSRRCRSGTGVAGGAPVRVRGLGV